jgi:diacylglycerol kinase (ATP)
VDVGIANGIPFINNMGTGFDSAVMRTMNTGIRLLRGRAAFNAAILKNIFAFPAFALTIKADEGEPRHLRALMVSVLNGKVYGAGMEAAPQAEVEDGRMDVLIVKAVPKMQRPALLTLVQHGKHLGSPFVEMFQVRKLSIQTIPPLPINRDGDLGGLTPVEMEVQPRALKVLVR